MEDINTWSSMIQITPKRRKYNDFLNNENEKINTSMIEMIVINHTPQKNI